MPKSVMTRGESCSRATFIKPSLPFAVLALQRVQQVASPAGLGGLHHAHWSGHRGRYDGLHLLLHVVTKAFDATLGSPGEGPSDGMVASARSVRISKTLTNMLRHSAPSIGLILDRNGAARASQILTRQHIADLGSLWMSSYS